MEPADGQQGPPAEEQGGLMTRECHVFKVPASKSSLLGKKHAVCWLSVCHIRTRLHATPHSSNGAWQGTITNLPPS